MFIVTKDILLDRNSTTGFSNFLSFASQRGKQKNCSSELCKNTWVKFDEIRQKRNTFLEM